MMKVKLKRLKNSDPANLLLAIEHLLKHKFNNWICPRRMQAYLISLGAEVTEEVVIQLMDDLYNEALDNPLKTFIRGSRAISYKCVAYFTPN